MKKMAKAQLEEIPDDYDPDYDLHLPRQREAEDLEPYLESGLAAGKKLMEEHISRFRSHSEFFKPYKSQLLDLTKLEAMLSACNYMVSITDKNLGAAIITRQWFITGSKACLSDVENYEVIDPAM
jgi:hypothetical protein